MSAKSSGRGTPATPAGRWTHTLCACSEDTSLCCSVCWCQCNATGQMYARMTASAPYRSRVCFAVAAGLWSLAILEYVLSQSSEVLARTAIDTECTWLSCTDVVDWNQVASAYIVGAIAAVFGCLFSVLSVITICTSRRRLRVRDAIPPDDCDDCCTSYWCACCALIQMLRQERIRGASYSVCSATGEFNPV
jgi:Cys-rich protein (TIGR01571 family)